MAKQWCVLALVFLRALTVIASILALASCVSRTPISPEAVTPQSERSGPVESAPSDASTPITVRLILSEAPRLNEPVSLTFTISLILDAPGTTPR